MPQINLYGSGGAGGGGNNPRTSRGAAWASYERSQGRAERSYTAAERQAEAQQQRREETMWKAQEASQRRQAKQEKEDQTYYFRQRAQQERREEQARVKWKRIRDQEYNRDYRLAQWEATDRRLQSRAREHVVKQASRAAAQKYNDDYRLASRMNSDMDLVARQQRAGQISNTPLLRMTGLFAGRHTQHAISMMLAGRGGRGLGGGGGAGGGGGGGGGFGGGLAAFGSRAALPAAAAFAAYEIAKHIALAPQTIANGISGLASRGAGYMDLRMGAAGLGRAGGFEGMDLVNRLFPRAGANPEWMRSRGITPLGGIQTLQAYGLPITGGDEGQRLLEHIYDARNMPYLGGMEPNRYAQSLGMANTLGVHLPGGAAMTGRSGQTEAYFRELQKVMYTANLLSLDHSQVLNTVEGLMRAQVSLGGTNPSISGTADFWQRYASGGAAGGRTGETQMSVMQATSQFAGGAGFGGNVAGNTMLHSYFAKNGGIPKTREALEAQLGVKYATLSSAEQKQFDDALDAAQHGDEASFFSLLQPWLNDPDRMKRFAEGSGLVPRGGYMNPLLGGAYTGLTPWQYNQGAAAKGLTPHMHEQFMQAAGGDPHLTAILEAIGSHESGFNARAVPRDKHGRLLSSARGIMQLTKATAEYEGITADESFDPDKNIAAGSRRFREALAKANGNVDEALARYYLGDQGFEQEGFNGPHNAGAYVRAVKSQIASFEPHGGDDTNPNTVAGSARNNTSDVQAAQSLEGQAAMQASRQAFEALTHIEETAGSTLLAFSGSIASATDEVGKFIKALKDAVGELGGGNSTTPNTARSSAGGNAMPGGPGSLAMP